MELFAFLSFWWYLLFIIASAIIFITTYFDRYWINTVLFLVISTLLYFLGGSAIFNFIIQHPLTVIFYLLCYVFVGSIYMIISWYLFCLKQKKELEFKLKNNPKTKREFYINLYIPNVSDHIGNLVGKTMWWPFALINNIIGDWIVQFFRWTVERFSMLLKNIQNSVFKDYKKELEQKEKEEDDDY